MKKIAEGTYKGRKAAIYTDKRNNTFLQFEDAQGGGFEIEAQERNYWIQKIQG